MLQALLTEADWLWGPDVGFRDFFAREILLWQTNRHVRDIVMERLWWKYGTLESEQREQISCYFNQSITAGLLKYASCEEFATLSLLLSERRAINLTANFSEENATLLLTVCFICCNMNPIVMPCPILSNMTKWGVSLTCVFQIYPGWSLINDQGFGGAPMHNIDGLSFTCSQGELEKSYIRGIYPS